MRYNINISRTSSHLDSVSWNFKGPVATLLDQGIRDWLARPCARTSRRCQKSSTPTSPLLTSSPFHRAVRCHPILFNASQSSCILPTFLSARRPRKYQNGVHDSGRVGSRVRARRPASTSPRGREVQHLQSQVGLVLISRPAFRVSLFCSLTL